ncbi:hypothetical protein G7Z17_g13188 [Cylindrodendrum hubeiense]|uniref:Uncharacterized protein n=1 Tax=Cylindrodendrum hubeiense TaxID=595255 RepID=A0A9P5L9T8_9HYPO|nr:hypothetical protein G7Z17_g13188 [Cylindrodendrum hubeiense]
MRVSSVLLLAGGAMANAKYECFVNNNEDLASFADCGHQGALARCLSELQSFDETDVRACYTNVGCSADQAALEAKQTLERCEEMANNGDLKKRFRAAAFPRADAFIRADATTAADASSATGKSSKTGTIYSGTDCFSTGTTSTSSCKMTTSSGHTLTGTCVPSVMTTSTCDPTLVCTVDSSSNDICMDLHHMDVGGIVVAIVFAGFLVIGGAALTWACCKDRKEQKRLIAKAEVTALARAATKKQRAAQRAPLLRKASGGSAPGGANPFQDQSRL